MCEIKNTPYDIRNQKKGILLR